MWTIKSLRKAGPRILIALTLALPAGHAWAGGRLDANTLQIIDTGEDNLLMVLQSSGGGHRASITLSGRHNGAASADFAPNADWFGPLAPGHVSQSGHGQSLSLSVAGTGNLFAVMQTGALNVAQGRISGIANQASISQAGHGNSAVFSQIGQRNTIAISQSM